jgi:hypothetical protein
MALVPGGPWLILVGAPSSTVALPTCPRILPTRYSSIGALSETSQQTPLADEAAAEQQSASALKNRRRYGPGPRIAWQ